MEEWRIAPIFLHLGSELGDSAEVNNPVALHPRRNMPLPPKSFIYQLMHKSCFKRVLKFTLKQLLHVSVQSPSSGSVFFELAKVIVIKTIS
jgi:hypothetical protein